MGRKEPVMVCKIRKKATSCHQLTRKYVVLLGAGEVPHVGVIAPSVVGLLVALPGVHSPGVHKMRSHGGDVIKHSFDY